MTSGRGELAGRGYCAAVQVRSPDFVWPRRTGVWIRRVVHMLRDLIGSHFFVHSLYLPPSDSKYSYAILDSSLSKKKRDTHTMPALRNSSTIGVWPWRLSGGGRRRRETSERDTELRRFASASADMPHAVKTTRFARTHVLEFSLLPRMVSVSHTYALSGTPHAIINDDGQIT